MVKHIVRGAKKDRRYRMGLHGWTAAGPSLCGETGPDVMNIDAARANVQHAEVYRIPGAVETVKTLCPACLAILKQRA